ncbi:MAG: hypothetical protein Q7Q71_12545 [Verrucomicrobiota bacterium JB023]|nr:hypothetical protein [Verrucomicrobiota bacterium JB023]
MGDGSATMRAFYLTLCCLFLGFGPTLIAEETRIAELDQFWAKVSKAVNEGDFESYRETCHEEAVLVTGVKKTSYPLAQALSRWKTEFDDTKAGKMDASVTFRFSHRYGDETTAHEAGMFLYSSQMEGGEKSEEYIHFEGLLVKKDGRWLMLMEYQKSVGTKAEWDALKP